MRLLLQSKSFLSKKFCFNQNFQTRSRLHINLYILGRPFNMHVYWDLILEWSDSHLLNRKQPWWLPAKTSCLFVLVFRSGKCSKGTKKTRTLIFLLLLLTLLEFYQHLWVLSTILSSPATDVKWNKSAPSRYVV